MKTATESAQRAEHGPESPFTAMMAEFDAAAAALGIAPSVYGILRAPDREVSVSLPIVLDDGSFKVLTGYKVQHNQGLGPFLGPLLLKPGIGLDELRALAGWMTWECALLGIPFGGSAGGIPIDPLQMSRGEVERAIRRYTAGLLDLIGPERDIFMPDTGTDSGVMAWIMDTVSMHLRHTENAVVAGKPLALGGTLGSEDAGARGLLVVLEHALAHYSLPTQGARILIQGAGRVGGNAARLLHARGHKVCGLADENGALYDANGLDVPSILDARTANRYISQIEGAFEHLSLEQLVAKPCDVLLPCAVANTITAKNAANVQARLIVEGAHGPVSLPADEILAKRDVPVVPHILSNGGGVVSAYIEWVQNRQGLAWQADRVDKDMNYFMSEAWKAVVAHAQDRKLRLRKAAHQLAVMRVAHGSNLRGLYA
jgi:glutamate dehydrogenase (NAD(P)+)